MIQAALRCPDCFETRLRVSAGSVDAGVLCENCGREMALVGHVLHALPKTLAPSDDDNRNYYDTLSADEESLLAKRARTRNHRAKLDSVLDELGLRDTTGKRVLELGVGYGSHGAAIVQRGHAYFGVDISPGLLKQAALRFPEIDRGHLVCGDATRTPFANASFDAAFCVATLHHLERPEDGIREALRVLRPGGRFCFLEPRRLYPTQFVQWFRHPKTEISAMKITERNLHSWTKAAGARTVRIGPNIFTPNGPAALIPAYDRADRFLRRHPRLHSLSVQICVSGER